jgi:hypothetical protein
LRATLDHDRLEPLRLRAEPRRSLAAAWRRIALGEAVRALDRLELGLPEKWDLCADMGDMRDACAPAVVEAVWRETIVDACGVMRLKMKLSALVIKYAVLGGAPLGNGKAAARGRANERRAEMVPCG